jgi:hypothetical protein
MTSANAIGIYLAALRSIKQESTVMFLYHFAGTHLIRGLYYGQRLL